MQVDFRSPRQIRDGEIAPRIALERLMADHRTSLLRAYDKLLV